MDLARFLAVEDLADHLLVVHGEFEVGDHRVFEEREEELVLGRRASSFRG